MGSWFLSPGQTPTGVPQSPPEHPPLLRVWARSTHGRELPDSLSLVLFPLHSSCRRCKLLHFQSLPWLVMSLQSPSAEIPGITNALSGHEMPFLVQIQGCQSCSVLFLSHLLVSVFCF